MKDYVERRNDSFYLIGSRVALAIIVREFQKGESPESIRWHYPVLSLEQVYGAITFYLANQDAVHEDLKERDRMEEELAKVIPSTQDIRKVTS
jgi:Tfp pilus assembly protein PilZ